ncbi:MAG: hypothetical protein GEU98_29470 [Pseudonocardiaceae bacterium]|nr:hypothetical protein [Pseudonocardiaceae bacterium]
MSGHRSAAALVGGFVGNDDEPRRLCAYRLVLDPTGTQRRCLEQHVGAARSPFDSPVPREFVRDARWVEPVLVGEVQFRELTADGYLRHPSWQGLRPDKNPREVVRVP